MGQRGKRTGQYRLAAAYAGTEVATAYRATGRRGRPVVVKLPQVARDGRSRPTAAVVTTRLAREATVLATVSHPHCVRLVDVVGRARALVFDHPPGMPLRLVARPMPPLRAARVIGQVLKGLQALHDRGLVHRDVRPEHIWLDVHGNAVLANFELAVAGDAHPHEPRGTLPYASPEQRHGQPLDPRSDLYSCGVVLAELLTGELPAALAAPRAGHRPPRRAPAPLANLLEGMLSEDPAGRPASAADLGARLARAVASLS